MFNQANMLFMVCETPLHAGSGNDLGIVDLPIQRERQTSFPKIEASSLKGALRQAFELNRDNKTFSPLTASSLPCELISINANKNQHIQRAFGAEEGDLYASALGFTDARLLFFPVKSLRGIFAWVTCKRVLERFQQDFALTANAKDLLNAFDFSSLNINAGECVVLDSSSVELSTSDVVVLEEYTFTKQTTINAKGQTPLDTSFKNLIGLLSQQQSYRNSKLANDIVVLADDDFKSFVELSTEVITRIKMDNEKGTVQKGGLFTEEYLPTESILYSLVLSSRPYCPSQTNKVADKVADNEGNNGNTSSNPSYDLSTVEEVLHFFKQGLPSLVQVGGNATLGKGIVSTIFLEDSNLANFNTSNLNQPQA